MAGVHAEAAIAKASRKEPATAADRGTPIFSWNRLKPFAGLAVAASVALVTVVLWQPLEDQDGQKDVADLDRTEVMPIVDGSFRGTAVPVSTRVQTPGTRWKVERDLPGLQQKLNAYLVNHTEYSNSVQGLIPQARVAGFDSPQ